MWGVSLWECVRDGKYSFFSNNIIYMHVYIDSVASSGQKSCPKGIFDTDENIILLKYNILLYEN